MANLIELKDDDFKSEVLDANIPVVVDFWATWCGPCRKLTPLVEEISTEYNGKVKFVKVNTEQCFDTVKEYSISGLPTIMIFKNGEPVERLAGFMPKSTIISNIEKYI